MKNLNVYNSLITSITIQVITGIIEFFSLFVKVPNTYSFLKQMMMLELFVQVIESSFYIYWLYNYKSISNITPKRYFDWVITTPTMLINLIFYLIFLEDKENNTSYKLNFFNLFKKEFNIISVVLILNWAMLLFGYLSETSKIPVLLGVSLGFIPFLIYYYIIYINFAIKSKDGLKIYFYFLFFWSLYGLAALLPYKIKNTCYNILDLFAKNFFGLFLTYLLYTHKE